LAIPDYNYVQYIPKSELQAIHEESGVQYSYVWVSVTLLRLQNFSSWHKAANINFKFLNRLQSPRLTLQLLSLFS